MTTNRQSDLQLWTLQYINQILKAVDISIDELLVQSNSSLFNIVNLMDESAHKRLYTNLLDTTKTDASNLYSSIADSQNHIALHFGLMDREPEYTIRCGALIFDEILLQDIATRTLSIRSLLGSHVTNIRLYQILRVIRDLYEYIEADYVHFLPHPIFASSDSFCTGISIPTDKSSLMFSYIFACVLGATPFTTWESLISHTLSQKRSHEARPNSPANRRVIRNLELVDIVDEILSNEPLFPYIKRTSVSNLLNVASQFEGFRAGLRDYSNNFRSEDFTPVEHEQWKSYKLKELNDQLTKELEAARQNPSFRDLLGGATGVVLISLAPDPVTRVVRGFGLAKTLITILTKAFWKPQTSNPFLLGMMDLKRGKTYGRTQ